MRCGADVGILSSYTAVVLLIIVLVRRWEGGVFFVVAWGAGSLKFDIARAVR